MTVKTKRVNKRLIKSARTDSKRIHITPRTNGWAVRKEGNFHATRVLETQQKAIDFAEKWVKSGNASSIIVHTKDGNFRTSK
ncbi:MAG: DUF2188 domain-containing protein [Chitinophagales bacterium]